MIDFDLYFGANCTELQWRNRWLAGIYIFEGVFYTIIYLPCVIVLWRVLYHKNSCYKLMTCMGVVDLLALFIACTYSGVLCAVGLPVCSNENFFLAKITACLGFGIKIV